MPSLHHALVRPALIPLTTFALLIAAVVGTVFLTTSQAGAVVSFTPRLSSYDQQLVNEINHARARAHRAPLHLVAGEHDDITPREEVFHAESLVGTAKDAIERTVAPGGHIGLFMSKRNVANVWPAIGRWILAHETAAGPGGKRA